MSDIRFEGGLRLRAKVDDVVVIMKEMGGIRQPQNRWRHGAQQSLFGNDTRAIEREEDSRLGRVKEMKASGNTGEIQLAPQDRHRWCLGAEAFIQQSSDNR